MSGNVRQQQAAVEQVVLSAAFILLALLFVVVFAWLKAHTAISRTIMDFMVWQLRTLDWRSAHNLIDRIDAIPPSAVTLGLLFQVVAVVSAQFALPVSILVTIIGIVLVIAAPSTRHATPLNLDGLMRVQAPVFRSMAAYLPRRLRPVAPSLPVPLPADPALHLGEWLTCHALDPDGRFQRHCALDALEAQLGDIWSNLEAAPAPARMMIAVCALHAARRRDEAAALLGQVSESLAGDARNEGEAGPAKPLILSTVIMSTVDQILTASDLRPEVDGVLRQHAFVTTAVMGVLNRARARAGILPPAQFNFLKLIDRNLWYALQSLGFPVSETEDGPMPNPKIEALAARAHWQAERAAGQPLFVPHIDMAIDLIGDRVASAESSQTPLKDLR